MKYRVTGTNHDTGARMSLEMEAESKAAAERKAHSAGMDVMHVQDITVGDQPHAERHTHRGEDSGGGMGSLIKLLIVLVIIAAVVYFGWARTRGMIGR